ncbi:hypothetical protein SGRIM128S_07017 [Streptomyces griseomycini]
MPGGTPDRLHGQLGVAVGRGAQHHAHVLGRVPAEGGGPGHGPLVGLTAQHGVHHQRLQARVPGTPCLGRLRVHLGGGEGDLPGVDEEGLAQDRLVARRRHLVDGRLHDLDGGAHHLHGLPQRDGPGQLARRGAEDVGGDGLRGVGVPEPLGEGGDARLGDQTDPGTVLRWHGPVPGQRLVHPRDGLCGEAAGGLLQPLQRRGMRVGGAARGGVGAAGFGFGHGDKTASYGREGGPPGPWCGLRWAP